MTRFLGITRERVFSPGRVEDDGTILTLVAECLRRDGHDVAVYDGDAAAWPEPPPGSVVFTMCQGPAALARLQRWHDGAVRIVNRPEAILNCQRHRTVAVFAHAAIPFPETVLVDPGDAGVALPSWVDRNGAWVKRGDVHATEADDVVRASHGEAVRAALRRFRARGIRRAVVQRHVSGTVVKFYAVWRRFFFCAPPGGALPADLLHRIDTVSQRAAAALGVEIYGGDCVYDANGDVTLIDLNDWPSYLSCRAAAARAIAAHVQAQVDPSVTHVPRNPKI